MMRSLHLTLVLTFGLASTPALSANATVFISGRVVARTTHAAIAGATVSLFPINDFQPADTSLTLQNGAFVLKAPMAGKYRVLVQSSSVRTLRETIDVPGAGIESLELNVLANSPLKLRIIGPDGQDVKTGELEVWGSLSWQAGGSAILPVRLRPGPDGMVSVTAPQSTPLDLVSQVRISVRDAELGCGRTHLDGWPDEPATVYLEHGASVAGTVVNAAGKPVPEIGVGVLPITAARIVLGPLHYRRPDGGELGIQMDLNPENAITAHTDENGRFKVPALFFGRYVVAAEIPGVGTRSRKVNLTSSTNSIILSPSDRDWPPPDTNPLPRFRRGFPMRPNPLFEFDQGIPFGLPWKNTLPMPIFPGPPKPAPNRPGAPLPRARRLNTAMEAARLTGR